MDHAPDRLYQRTILTSNACTGITPSNDQTCTHSRDGLTDTSDTESDSDVDEHADKLMYLPVTIANVQATALLGGGSSLNVMSQSML